MNLQGQLLGIDGFRNYVFSSLPVWVREKASFAPERIIPGYKKICAKLAKKIQAKAPRAPTGTSPSSVSDTPTPPVASMRTSSTKACPQQTDGRRDQGSEGNRNMNGDDMLGFMCKWYTIVAVALSLPALTLDLLHWILK